MTAPELIQSIEAAGGVLTLSGNLIRYKLPENTASMVEGLRQHRTEVIRVLREREQAEVAQATCLCLADGSEPRGQSYPDPYAVALEKTTQSEPPPMPIGVRLLRWAPQPPPVVIERWAVVTDIHRFIQTTLGQLQGAMARKNWLAGNRSVRELVERLEQVGVKVSVEEAR